MNENRNQILNISIFITIASTTLYIVFRNLGRELGSFAYLWAPITLLLIIGKRPNAFAKGPMKILLLYGVIMMGILRYTLWKYMSDFNQSFIIFEFYNLVVMTAIFNYYWGKDNFERLALLSKWAFIFIIITIIATNVALFIDPYLVRSSASTGDFTPFQGKVFKLTGAMGYHYAQAIVCLIPILIYCIKNKQKMVFSHKVLTAILLLIVVTQIRSQVFANLLVTAMITVLSFLGSKKRRSLFITILLFGILIWGVPKSFYMNIFSSSSRYFSPDSEMRYKLTDFANFIEYSEFDPSTGAGRRADRYPMLFKALIANPLWGDTSYSSHFDLHGGFHLYWMNRLTLWGIPGFLFFVFVLFKIFKIISSLFDAGYRFYYFLSLVAFIFLGLLKVSGGRELWLVLIVVIPGLYFQPLIQQSKHDRPILKDNTI